MGKIWKKSFDFKFSLKLFFFLILGSFLVSEYIVLNPTETTEKYPLTIYTYWDPLTDNYRNTSSKAITLHTPPNINPNGDLSPIVILIHGDGVTSKAFNFLKRQYLKNGYIVVTQTFDFSINTIFQLNETINFLRSHTIYRNHPIGVHGNSHGAHYAMYIGFLRADSLNFTICTNFGGFTQMRRDYYQFYQDFTENPIYLSYKNFIDNFRFPMNNNSFSNLLIQADKWDPAYSEFVSSVKNNVSGFWNVSTFNTQIGNFTQKTARELYLSQSLTSHTSGLLNPTVVSYQMDWIASSTNCPRIWSDSETQKDMIILWVNVGIVIILFFLLINDIFHRIFSQKSVISLIKEDFASFTSFGPQNDRDILFLSYGFENIHTKRGLDLTNQSETFYHKYVESETYFIIGKQLMILLITNLALFGLVLFIDPDFTIVYLPEMPLVILSWIYQINAFVAQLIYFAPLSFEIMYLWLVIIKGYQFIRFRGNIEEKFLKLNWKKFGVFYLIFFEIGVFFFIISYFGIYLWLGFNPINSLFTITINFMILYVLNYSISEFYQKNLRKEPHPTKKHRFKIFLFTLLFTFLVYLPNYFPTRSVSSFYIAAFGTFISNFLLIGFLNTYLFSRRKSVLLVSIIDLALILSRKVYFTTFLYLI